MPSHRRARSCRWIVLAMCCAGVGAYPQVPVSDDPQLAAIAAKRFPQPVRVGELIGRRVLAPLESRPVLGQVVEVIREPKQVLAIVMKRGGLLGFGGRLIAVPTDAIGLLGTELVLLDLTPEQLDACPTFTAADAAVVAADEEIRIGLAHPAH